MGRIEHITTQQIIGEWGSIDKFALSHGLNPVELIEMLRMKDAHPEVVSGLKRDGIWGLLETKGGRGERIIAMLGRCKIVRRDAG
jgi:hypothetical protein